jgi:3-methyladenine DNA glycosylase AlkD
MPRSSTLKVSSPGPSSPSSLAVLRERLSSLASRERAAQTRRFFKTGPGEYGEGDRFLGVSMPDLRSLLPGTDPLSEGEIQAMLASVWHEERMLGLLALVRRFGKARKQEARRQHLVDLYLASTASINNWDLVDNSAPHLLGAWLLDHDRGVLQRLASSSNLWEQRIAVLATLGLIRAGQFDDTLALCERFLGHPHDLMHKACGWMLREVGKRDAAVLRGFLDQHAPVMPRTMLRYAIEKMPERERKRYLSAR